jgi:hypothetical protein
MSGGIALGLAESGDTGTWFGPCYRTPSSRELRPWQVTDTLYPAAFSGVRVVVPHRVHIRARGKQCTEKRDLHFRFRPVIDQSRWRLEIRGLCRIGRSRLPRGELQQLHQPRVLCSQPRELSPNRHRNLSHAEKLSVPVTALATVRGSLTYAQRSQPVITSVTADAGPSSRQWSMSPARLAMRPRRSRYTRWA